jgi:SAM-dependent methyltransferase
MTETSDLPLPPRQLRYKGEDDQTLVDLGVRHANQLYDHGLQRAGSSVLDIGSGYGSLPLGLMATGFEGTYLGFDVVRRVIDWCQGNMTSHSQRYQFRHLDVHNDRYNKGGTLTAAEARFPAQSSSFDCCCVFSVFTHMYAHDIRRYLAEIHRVLRRGGVAVTTWFLFDQARIPAVTSEKSNHRLVYSLNAVTRFANPDDPLHVIGYEESFVRTMGHQAVLEVQQVRRGRWAGEDGYDFQDMIVFRKPSTVLARARAWVAWRR